jgi:hypothetical protein
MTRVRPYSPAARRRRLALSAAVLHPDLEYLVTLSLAYCTDSNRGLCVPVTLKWRVRLAEDSQAPSALDLSATVSPL